MNGAIIKAWAKKPENKDKAVVLGKRLYNNQDAETLRSLPSLGEFEDKAIEWAIAHPIKAKTLVIQLLPLLMK
jgi:hypothetical protein